MMIVSRSTERWPRVSREECVGTNNPSAEIESDHELPFATEPQPNERREVFDHRWTLMDTDKAALPGSVSVPSVHYLWFQRSFFE